MTPRTIAQAFEMSRPDRGNLYAARSVRSKGAAQYAFWVEQCRYFSGILLADKEIADRAAWLAKCGMTPEEIKAVLP